MPPPPLPVNGVRPKPEERRAPQGPVGKGILSYGSRKSSLRPLFLSEKCALSMRYYDLFTVLKQIYKM